MGVVVASVIASCGKSPAPGDLPSQDLGALEVPEPIERVVVPGGPGVFRVPGAAGAPSAGSPAPARRAANPPLFPEEGTLDVLSPEPAVAGTPTVAYLRLVASRGYEINEKFHYKLTLDPTPGVTLAKSVFSHAGHDADRLDAHELAITMTLTADAPGDHVVRGRLDFAVCKIDSQCLPKTMPVAVLVAAR